MNVVVLIIILSVIYILSIIGERHFRGRVCEYIEGEDLWFAFIPIVNTIVLLSDMCAYVAESDKLYELTKRFFK